MCACETPIGHEELRAMQLCIFEYYANMRHVVCCNCAAELQAAPGVLTSRIACYCPLLQLHQALLSGLECLMILSNANMRVLAPRYDIWIEDAIVEP